MSNEKEPSPFHPTELFSPIKKGITTGIGSATLATLANPLLCVAGKRLDGATLPEAINLAQREPWSGADRLALRALLSGTTRLVPALILENNVGMDKTTSCAVGAAVEASAFSRTEFLRKPNK